VAQVRLSIVEQQNGTVGTRRMHLDALAHRFQHFDGGRAAGEQFEHAQFSV